MHGLSVCPQQSVKQLLGLSITSIKVVSAIVPILNTVEPQ